MRRCPRPALLVALLVAAGGASCTPPGAEGATVHAVRERVSPAAIAPPVAGEDLGAPVPARPEPDPVAVPPRPVAVGAGATRAEASGVALVLPSASVERVGFHQSNHEGAVDLAPLVPAEVPHAVLEGRDRLTAATTAADVVVEPGRPVLAPVTGRVKRAGGYVLYCRHRDDYVVIEPDSRPGWEVKLLHLDGEVVEVGQRVEAGRTTVAAAARLLPFESQVDALRAADPAWPHVHVEVVDPTVRNVPSPGGGC